MTSTEPTTFARILAELSDPDAVADSIRHEHSPFHLADLADCGSPDSSDSPGARFLASVARDVADSFTPDTSDSDPDEMRQVIDNLNGDGAHEIADSAVPIYTHERWLTFVDLQAYQEDVSELGATTDDMTGAAGVALYMIAERLVRALAEELGEALNEDDDSGEWIVTDGEDGAQIAGPFATEEEAQDRADQLQARGQNPEAQTAYVNA